MADILKISTPLVERNNLVHPNKQAPESGTQFQMIETARVVKSNPQSELLQQNNGMPLKNQSPAILMDLLRDPSVTMNFLKNIYLLQEIINLIPASNDALTQEINQMVKALMVSPQEIAGELQKQEGDATVFRGELFDMLRTLLTGGKGGLASHAGAAPQNAAAAQNLSDQNQPLLGRPELRYAVANLLKALNASLSKEEILTSVANNLTFLAGSMPSAKSVYNKLMELAQKFQEPFAAKEFPTLKAQTMLLLRDVENSILFTPKMERIIPLVTYNLSRFNDNPDFLEDTATALMNLLEGNDQKNEFLQKLKGFLQGAPMRRGTDQEYEVERASSKVMETLAKLIGKEASNEELSAANSEKLEKIIHSLLSSPCNFTPLLHFIVPVEDQQLHSFAEIWIESGEEGSQEKRGDAEENMHLLMVFDVAEVGQFEAELFVSGKKLGLNLLCPPAYTDRFLELRDYAAKIAAGTSYSLSEIYIGSLERPRSLMDVFKTLPHRRAGIDVKV